MNRKTIVDRLRRKKTISRKMEQLMLTMEELDRDITTVLTTNNPYFDENAVEFSQKDMEYRPLQNRNSTIIIYCQKGNIKRKDIETDSKDVIEVEESVEELDTKRKNKFNFCDRGTQTQNQVDVEKHTQTVPLPQLAFDATASPADIRQAYRHKELEAKLNGEDEKPSKGTRKSSRKEVKNENPVSQRRYLRFCERMIDQNLLSDVNIDYSFYDTPSDEFKEKGFGSLLALWKFSYSPMKGATVTGLSWNTRYPDMFAVSFGTDDPSRRRSGEGCVCVFSLKCPSHPERAIRCKAPVQCVHVAGCGYLVAAGGADGSVAAYDLRTDGGSSTPLATNRSELLEHSDVVHQVKWLPDNIDGRQNFCSISADNRVINWLLAKSELIPTEVINLQDTNVLSRVPEPHHLNIRSGGGTSFSFHPGQRDLFLVGTEGGAVLKWSHLATAQLLDSYRDHANIVYSVHWNPFHPRVFLSCSADWTIRVWDHAQQSAPGGSSSVFTFDVTQEVRDVAWAPFSATLFAALTADGKVHIFDLLMSRRQATSTTAVYTSRKNVGLTSLRFNPARPVLIVGDDKGSVISFKLSPNLRSSLKAFQTTERSKFAMAESEKLEKILKLARNPENYS